jgi:voltage-gated potassium channel
MLVLQFESTSPAGNIKTGGEAIWWGLVTITTVGYGDFYPVTMGGRLTGIFVMFAGIGIIGALASILASLLVSPSTPDEPAPDAAAAPAPDSVTAPSMAPDAIVEELALLRAEIAELRESLSAGRT